MLVARTVMLVARTVMLVAVATLVLSLFVTNTLASCPEGFVCNWENDIYVLLCKLKVIKLKLYTGESTIAHLPPQTTRLKIQCYNPLTPVQLTFSNLSHIRELTLERINLTTRERYFFHGVSNITRLVLRHLLCRRFEESYFKGLTDLRSLEIEHLDKLEYLHPNVLKPLMSLESLSFRYVGSGSDVLLYRDYSRLLGGIQSPSFHTLTLYAIHSAQHTEIHLNIDDLFSNGTVGASLKHLDLGRNNVQYFNGTPERTLPSIEYVSVAENVVVGSRYTIPFWVQLVGHKRLKTLDISGINSLASPTSGGVLISLTVLLTVDEPFE